MAYSDHFLQEVKLARKDFPGAAGVTFDRFNLRNDSRLGCHPILKYLSQFLCLSLVWLSPDYRKYRSASTCIQAFNQISTLTQSLWANREDKLVQHGTYVACELSALMALLRPWFWPQKWGRIVDCCLPFRFQYIYGELSILWEMATSSWQKIGMFMERYRFSERWQQVLIFEFSILGKWFGLIFRFIYSRQMIGSFN